MSGWFTAPYGRHLIHLLRHSQPVSHATIYPHITRSSKQSRDAKSSRKKSPSTSCVFGRRCASLAHWLPSTRCCRRRSFWRSSRTGWLKHEHGLLNWDLVSGGASGGSPSPMCVTTGEASLSARLYYGASSPSAAWSGRGRCSAAQRTCRSTSSPSGLAHSLRRPSV